MSHSPSTSVQFDLAPIKSQIDELQQLLERLPESVRDSFRSRLSDLADFGIEAETLPATDAGSYVLRFRSVALAELCAATSGAADGNRS